MDQISIIIPCVNEAENLKSLLPYLTKNGAAFLKEIIVVDGASTDDTTKVATDNGAIVVKCAKRSRALQMNLGAKTATAKELFFLHADTLPPTNYAQSILTALEAGKEMGCFPYVFDSDKLLLKFNAFMTTYDWTFCRGGDQGLFISKENFESLGGFDINFVIMEDYDFLRRARKQFSFVILPDRAVVSARKYHENSYFKVNFANFIVFTMYRIGLSPTIIARLYKTLLNYR